MPLDASRQNRYQQIGYQNNPCLYLYGVDAVPIEEMKREVLFNPNRSLENDKKLFLMTDLG